MKSLKIATRKSPLALAQTQTVISRLREHHPDLSVSVVSLTSTGDEDLRPLEQFSEIGIFVKTLEKAILRGEVDCALHCLKDLPAPISDEFALPCYLPREGVEDALIYRSNEEKGDGLTILSKLKKLATGSLRRRAFLKRHYSQLVFTDLRGNINTRLNKVARGEVEGIVLAQVGIDRLHNHYLKFQPSDWNPMKGREDFLNEFKNLEIVSIPTNILPPSPGQGILVLQCRADDSQVNSLLSSLNHSLTEKMGRVEREVMMRVEGGCRTPLGVWSRKTLSGTFLIEAKMEREGKVVTTHEEEKTGEISSLLESARLVADNLLKNFAG